MELLVKKYVPDNISSLRIGQIFDRITKGRHLNIKIPVGGIKIIQAVSMVKRVNIPNTSTSSILMLFSCKCC